MREGSRSFWKKKTMSRPRGGGGAPACEGGGGDGGIGRRVLRHPGHRLQRHLAPADLQRGSRAG